MSKPESKLRVIVKGNRFQAARAAADRGIPFVFKQAHQTLSETVGYIPETYRDNVAQWLCEPGTAPYPVGTCLFYSEESKS